MSGASTALCLFTATVAVAHCGSGAPSLQDHAGDASTQGIDAGATDAGTDAQPPLDAGPVPVGPIAATMNDVSILFPLPTTAAENSLLLPPSASGARGVLLPPALYANPAIGPIAGSTNSGDGGPGTLDPNEGPAQTSQIAEYSDLRVVAMRIDPCFASLSPDPHGAGCAAQLRLIFQEITASTGSFAAADSGLHAFYSLTRDDFLRVAEALVDLRKANQAGVQLGPLAPHPIVVQQGLSGAFAKGVEALILEYAGAQNLVRAAQISSEPNGLAAMWSLSAVYVTDPLQGATSPFEIPTLPLDAGVGPLDLDDAGNVVNQTMLAGAGLGSFGNPDASDEHVLGVSFDPGTTSTDDLTPLAENPEGISSTQRQAAFDALVRVENPADNSVNTIDCASCHIATVTEENLAKPLFSLDDTTSPLSFQPDGTSVTAADMAITFDATYQQQNGINVHAFSYVDQEPVINQRVVNETAMVVHYLNNLPQ